mmetsp:Transcript_8712/g.22857  ORF Transcript_8712/g.22857 Transcript_8712/m.22857 type:complete len:186 (-) Transcript_8712:244-801(-)
MTDAVAEAASGGFVFPAFYSFAPSFTRQPVAATRTKQEALWADLIRDYCRHHNIFWLDVASAASSALFVNNAIQRRVAAVDVVHFLDALVARGDGAWDEARSRCLVFWKRPEAWGDLIYQWIEASGNTGSVMTVFELRLSESTRDEPFHNLDLELMLRALSALETAGKAAVFTGERSDSLGVKFL